MNEKQVLALKKAIAILNSIPQGDLSVSLVASPLTPATDPVAGVSGKIGPDGTSIETLEAAHLLVQFACIASCECNTKTPDAAFHLPTCRYSKLQSALENIEIVIAALRARSNEGTFAEEAKFVQQHYGAVVATIMETEDTLVEVCQRHGGDFDLTIHSRRGGESDRFDYLTASLKPEHFEALGSVAKAIRSLTVPEKKGSEE